MWTCPKAVSTPFVLTPGSTPGKGGGVTFLIGVPGADDVMLNYQSTSFHDALMLRQVLGLKRAPEFEAWLQRMGLTDEAGQLLPVTPAHPLLQHFGGF